MFIKVEIKFIFNYSESNINFDVYLYKFDITKFMEKDKKKLNHNNEVLKNETNKKRLDFQISLNLLLEILNKIKFLKRKPRFIIENYLEFGLDEARRFTRYHRVCFGNDHHFGCNCLRWCISN